MNPFERFGATLTRIATVTSVIRTRQEDAERFDLHGGTVSEMEERVAETATRLEQVAARLEARI